jgi:hypothetical protein
MGRISTGKKILLSALAAILLLSVNSETEARQSGLQSPAEFLGYELGERFTYHHRVVAYFEHVAANSEYVTLEYYGVTTERRPLFVAYVSSPDNLSNLDEIRVNNLRRAGLADGNPVDDGKAILWMSYNIHGNEAASIEASMQTVYELATPDYTRSKPWLEDVVVVMDPALNPDGSERYAVWFNQVMGSAFNPYPLSREHREPSPNGRLNHYHFDMNRDWAWHTQHETRQRNAIYQRWLPHVHADFHEMGGYRYFFAPAASPFHTSITDWQKSFQQTIGENHAGYFDANDRLYFTAEIFDLFYPSYGDTWPTFQGAIGMTYEQGGSWGAGLAITTPEGHLHTFVHRVENQHIVGMSTVEVVAAHNQRVSQEFKRYFDVSRNNPQTTYKSYVLRVNDANRDNVAAMLDLFDAHLITYGAGPNRRNVRAFDYATGETRAIQVSDQDIVLSMYQPKSVLANVLMEPRTTVVDSLTYDITAWALPYVYGIEAYATTERLEPSGDGRALVQRMHIMGFPDPVYAYVFSWNSFEDARFLAALHEAGVRVRIAQQPLQVGQTRFERGALVITRHNNEDLEEDVDIIVRRLASQFGRIPHATSTGFTGVGIDLGSENVVFAKAPRVVTFAGDGIMPHSFGEIWHFFDQELQYPVTIINTGDIGQLNFFDFDVMVLPSGRYGDLFTGRNADRLYDWLNRGGRLVAVEGVVNQLSTLRGVDGLKSISTDASNIPMDDRLRSFGERNRQSRSTAVAGSIYRVSVDNTHPLGFGYSDTYYTLKRHTDTFEYLERGWNVGHIPSNGYMSGFAGYKVKQKLEETLNFGVIPVGRGSVVVMVDNPLFRGFWYNGKLLFSNAILQPM